LHVSQYPLGIKTRVSYTGWDKKQLCVTYNRSLKDLSSGVEIKLDSASINSYSAASMTAIFPLLGGGGAVVAVLLFASKVRVITQIHNS
jgi:hypothetical protein